MLKCFANALGKNSLGNFFAPQNSLLNQQTRNVFVLKRRFPVPLYKKGGKPIKLKSRHFVYDLIEDTTVVKKPDMTIILKQYVAGVGEVGDIITLKPNEAYNKYLLPGFAVYYTPENKEKYKALDKSQTDQQHSSPYAQRTADCLSRLVLQIIMNKSQSWTLEPWHVRASFRKAGFVVPEDAIQMPPATISGPDLSLQDKEFYVVVTINNKEEVKVRCRIHHWAVGVDRLPWSEFHWKKPAVPLFPEQADDLANMPLPS